MMTLRVPVTTTPLHTPVPSPTGGGNDGRFADVLAAHLAQRSASPQPRTDGARDHSAPTGGDGPRPAPTDERRVDGRTNDVDRRSDRSSDSERAHEPVDRSADRIGDRDRPAAGSSVDDTTPDDDVGDTQRTEAGGTDGVESRPPGDEAGDNAAEDAAEDATSAPTDGTDEAAETVAATAAPVALDAEARVAALALGALIADAAPGTTAAPAGEAAAIGDVQAVARTLVAGVGAQTAEPTPTGANTTSLTATTAAATAAGIATAAAATGTDGTDGDRAVQTAPLKTVTDGDRAVQTAPLKTVTDGDRAVQTAPLNIVTDGDAAPVVSAPQASPITTTPATLPSALAAAPDVATTETPDQAGTPTTTTTTTRATDQQPQQPSATAPAPATTASPLGAAANPAVAVATVPTPATNAAPPAAAPTAVSTTTVDGSVATATSTTQALANPGVARGELTAPQRLAAVIVPEVARMRGTVGHRTLEIRLDPPDLGTVDLEIRSSGSTVTIVARTESAEAMLAVLRQRDSIEASLRDLGMDLSGFDVSAGTPERDEAETPRSGGPASGGASGEATDVDAAPLSPTNPEGSVFL